MRLGSLCHSNATPEYTEMDRCDARVCERASERVCGMVNMKWNNDSGLSLKMYDHIDIETD